MVTLDADFEEQLAEAMLDDAEEQGEQIGQDLKDTAGQNFQSYASRNDYDISHIWTDSEGPFVEREQNAVRIAVEWPELSGLFEHGVSPHTIRGSPLAFAWPSPPQGTRPQGAPSFVVTDEVNWGSVTGGINEARAIRNAMAEIRRALDGL